MQVIINLLDHTINIPASHVNQNEIMNNTLNVLIKKQNLDLCWRAYYSSNLKRTKDVVRLAIRWLDWSGYMDDPFLGKVVK